MERKRDRTPCPLLTNIRRAKSLYSGFKPLTEGYTGLGCRFSATFVLLKFLVALWTRIFGIICYVDICWQHQELQNIVCIPQILWQCLNRRLFLRLCWHACAPVSNRLDQMVCWAEFSLQTEHPVPNGLRQMHVPVHPLYSIIGAFGAFQRCAIFYKLLCLEESQKKVKWKQNSSFFGDSNPFKGFWSCNSVKFESITFSSVLHNPPVSFFTSVQLNLSDSSLSPCLGCCSQASCGSGSSTFPFAFAHR